MPQALPVGPQHYVQYLRTQPDAPRQEPARTTEIKGRKRHGEGVAYRLFGHHAVVLGRWVQTPPWIPEHLDTDSWGRVIEPDEAEALRQRMLMDDKIRDGWQPPKWHWRFYLEKFHGFASRIGLMNVQAYNLASWTPRRMLRVLYEWVMRKLFVHQMPEEAVGDWQPLHVVEDEDVA